MATTQQPPTMEIIPNGELKGIELALGEIDNDIALLPTLKEKAEAIKVVDQASFLEAGTLQTQTENIGGKDGGARLRSYFDITNTVINFLRNKRSTVQAKKQEIVDLLSKKRNEWAQKDREERAKEQRELDAKNKKTGAPKQMVLDSVPVTAGKRKVTTYPMEVVDADKFLKAWMRAKGDQKKDLRQFIILDVQALGKESRDMQDAQAFMKRFPGTACEKKETV